MSRSDEKNDNISAPPEAFFNISVYLFLNTVLQGLTQPKVSGYRNLSICTPLRYSYATFGLCTEIVDAPSYRVLDFEWGLNSFNWRYARFCINLP